MKNQYLKAAVLASALSLAMSSCSKQNDVQPVSQPSTAEAGVHILDGRLVFTNSIAFERIGKELEQKNAQEDGKGLQDWEKSLNFTSLRAAAAGENSQLEKLQNSGRLTPSRDLMEEFGFPSFYAAVISPSGEYQIGDKIYWFHDGLKHEVNSEAELQQVKQDPRSSKLSSKAGSQLVSIKEIKLPKNINGGFTNNAVQSNASPVDGKYLYSFYLNNDTGSARRLIFGTYIYTEEVGQNGNVFTWHTIMYLRSIYEYYSDGRRAWYSNDGNTRYQSINVHFDGTAARENYEYYGYHAITDISSSVTTSNNYDFSIADVRVQAPYNYNSSGTHDSTDPKYIFWNFTMTGSLYSYATVDTSHSNSVGSPGYTLW